MTATDKLRCLLDDCGVEWWPMHDIENGYREDRDTEFLVYGCKHVAHEWGCRLQVDMLTPEKAIAATLGAGTCRYEWSLADNGWADHTCSACGYVENTDIHVGLGWNFCPNCGAKIVGPTTNDVDAEVDE